MLELAADLLAALRPSAGAGRPLAVATVVGIEGSAPRGLGASMAWDGSAVIGSVAGGCVEGAVVDVLDRVLADAGASPGRMAAREIEFGIPDTGTEAEQALAVGLSCGGRLRFHLAVLQPDDPAIAALERAAAGVPARLALTAEAYETHECPGAYIDERLPAARLVITGAMSFAAALAAAGQAIGFRVTVVDPRSMFATAERFPGAEVVVEWPPEYLARTELTGRDAVCLLSHDDRYDAEALLIALRSPAFYVGAMGSRRTHERRVARLRGFGATEDELALLSSPIGLDLGAVTPGETAVSILAELIAVREGGSARPLREGEGAIHERLARSIL